MNGFDGEDLQELLEWLSKVREVRDPWWDMSMEQRVDHLRTCCKRMMEWSSDMHAWADRTGDALKEVIERTEALPQVEYSNATKAYASIDGDPDPPLHEPPAPPEWGPS
jgi:hypothetical protein